MIWSRFRLNLNLAVKMNTGVYQSSAGISSSLCRRSFVIQQIPSSNLFMVVVENKCDCSSAPAVSMDPIEVMYILLTRSHWRLQDIVYYGWILHWLLWLRMTMVLTIMTMVLTTMDDYGSYYGWLCTWYQLLWMTVVLTLNDYDTYYGWLWNLIWLQQGGPCPEKVLKLLI